MFTQAHNPQRKRNGFTLIEILVVMLLIAILATIGAGSFISSQQKGRDSRRKSDLKQISIGLEAYFNDTGTYPTSSAQGEIIGCAGGTVCSWGGEFSDAVGTVYMVQIPEDPSRNMDYYYYSPTGEWYQIYTRLENVYDRDVVTDVNEVPLVYGATVCGSFTCNYGIASVNTTPATGRTLLSE